MSKRKIGFIGFGAMARPMAAHLRRAGYVVEAYTPSGSGDGATKMHESPKALAQWADDLVLCVPTDATLRASLYGEKGALTSVKKNTLLLNTSTISPDCAEEVSKAAAEHGATLLDTPMSGSTPEAEAGALILLVGGTDAELERARPILEPFSKVIIHAGPAGAAARLKLVINGIMGGTTAIIAEAVAYGLSAGIDRDQLFEALGQVAVISPHHQRKLRMGQARDFPSQFPTRLMSKDMGLLIADCARVKAFAPALAVTAQSYALATKRHSDEDYAALIGAMEHSIVNTP